MAEGDSYARCVRHAVGIVGSEERLAARLGVDAIVVKLWLIGRSVPTLSQLSTIADIIVGNADQAARSAARTRSR